MRSITFSILLLTSFALLFVSACDSAGSEIVTSNNSNSRSTVASGNTSSGNTSLQDLNADQNANFAGSAQMRRIEEIRANANRGGESKIQSQNTRPAPEDSTVSMTLTDVAREVRTWKNDPVLARVEKTYDGGDGSIKIFLRNGKVIPLPGNSIANLGEIPASTVLSLAGVKTSVPRTKPGQDTPVKKADN